MIINWQSNKQIKNPTNKMRILQANSKFIQKIEKPTKNWKSNKKCTFDHGIVFFQGGKLTDMKGDKYEYNSTVILSFWPSITVSVKTRWPTGTAKEFWPQPSTRTTPSTRRPYPRMWRTRSRTPWGRSDTRDLSPVCAAFYSSHVIKSQFVQCVLNKHR